MTRFLFFLLEDVCVNVDARLITNALFSEIEITAIFNPTEFYSFVVYSEHIFTKIY